MTRHAAWLPALGMIGAMLLSPGAAAPVRAQPAEQGPWWNPRPSADDVLVPLGCDIAMAFRRIPVPVGEGPLADRRAIVGDEEAESAYSEFARDAFLAGAFGKAAEGHFWLGKYEVARGQYVAVTAGCEALAALSATDRALPQTGISWAEAARFAELATAAAVKADAAALPRTGDARAFLRLPTEAEWEYSARGGTAVPETAFRARLFPMDGPVTTYAHLFRAGTRPAVRPIGMLKPNPLGLHDIIGNAGEMVQDPYRLNRGGRLHGRAGGIIAKGGDVRTPPDRARAALRIEYAPMNPDGTPLSLPTLGLRLAAGMQVVTDLAAGTALREAWEREAAQTRAQLGDDPIALSRSLEATATTEAQREAIRQMRQAIVADRFARADAEGRAVRSAVGAGAVLVRGWRNADNVIAGLEKSLADARVQLRNDPAGLAAMQRDIDAALAPWRTNRATTQRALEDLVLQQLDTDPAVLAEQLAIWKNENPSEEMATLRRMADRFAALVTAARPARRIDPDPFVASLRAELGR